MLPDPVLVTGAAGFIGSHLSHRLMADGYQVLGLDNLNDYYDVSLKESRLERLRANDNFRFVKLDVSDRDAMASLFREHKFRRIIHLAAQAGVRYSLVNPLAYIDSNLFGFCNILEGCRHNRVPHLVYASSSSVYGANTKQPFSESDSTDHPVSLYGASKKANELMAHSYSHLYGLPTTGLRFFTVYGPWGRPDMAAFLFTRSIIGGKSIDIFNHGKMIRDFTYIDDVIEGVRRVMDVVPEGNTTWTGEHPDPATSYCPWQIFNIGNNRPVKLLEFIDAIEDAVGKKAIRNYLPLQPGDVLSTCADASRLAQATGFRPNTSVRDGIRQFVDWYRSYYQV